jgi:hypothetical protein
MNQHCKINVGQIFLRNIPLQLLQTDCSKLCQIITHFTELNFDFIHFVKEFKNWFLLKKLLNLIKKANVCCSYYYYKGNHIFTSWKAINC